MYPSQLPCLPTEYMYACYTVLVLCQLWQGPHLCQGQVASNFVADSQQHSMRATAAAAAAAVERLLELLRCSGGCIW